MEDILDTYALAPDPKRPLVNLDEFSKQLLSEVAPRQAARPSSGKSSGTPRRYDAMMRSTFAKEAPAHS